MQDDSVNAVAKDGYEGKKQAPLIHRILTILWISGVMTLKKEMFNRDEHRYE